MKNQFCIVFDFGENIMMLYCSHLEYSYRQCLTDGFNFKVVSTHHSTIHTDHIYIHIFIYKVGCAVSP
jgi:hypothetical protein